MSIFKSVVFVTSAAFIASSALTAGSIPTPSVSTASQGQVVSIQTAPDLLTAIDRSLETSRITPAKTAEGLEDQLASVQKARQDAEAATLEATENAVSAEEAIPDDFPASASLGGTSLGKLGVEIPEPGQAGSAALALRAQGLFDQAEGLLDAKRMELVTASAALHKTTIAREEARLAKLSESREEAELMAALEDSDAHVADPINEPELDPEALDGALAKGARGGTSVASASIHLPTKKLTRTARINKSVKWAQKIAKNNKYKYRYGATGPKYFDCSGYVGKAFAQGGKKLKRTSSAQYKAAPKKVKLSNLKKGDLVFWSSNRGRSFYHVAVYVGNGKIAHARNPKAGISVTKLNYAGMQNIYQYAGRY